MKAEKQNKKPSKKTKSRRPNRHGNTTQSRKQQDISKGEAKKIVEDNKELSEKEKMFVQEFLVDFSAVKAARRAGYAESTATSQSSKLLAKIGVHHAITEALKARAERLDLKAVDIVNGLIKIYQRSMQETLVLNIWGEPTGFWKFDAKSALKALELLGKHFGMFPTNVKLTNDPDNPISNTSIVLFIPENGRLPATPKPEIEPKTD